MPVVIMTKEENKIFTQPGQLGQAPELVRRSRSLSELPGHLRVPILKRKDTERTQARLKAGDAGVQELRDLREQHEQRMNETMAAVQHKRKKKKENVGDTLNQSSPHRLQKQQELDHTVHHQARFRPLSASHSSSSLARISEERENSFKTAPKPGELQHPSHTPWQQHQPRKHDPHHRIYHMQHPDHQHGQQRHQHKSAWSGHQPDDTTNRDRSEQHRSHHQRGASKSGGNASPVPHQSNSQSHSHILTSPIGQHGRNRSYSSPNGHSRHKENANLSHGAEYIPNENHKPRKPQGVEDHRRKTVQEESHERFDRGRSQSVHENFNYFPDSRGINLTASSLHDQKQLHGGEKRNQSEISHQPKHSESKNFFSYSRSESNFNTSYSPHHVTESGSRRAQSHLVHEKDTDSSPTEGVLSHHNMLQSSRQRTANNKSISWDNLLLSIGINSTGSVASLNDSYDVPEQDDEIFYNIVPSETNHVNLSREKISKNDEVPTQRMGRSKSFTSSALSTDGPVSTYDTRLSMKERNESPDLNSALNTKEATTAKPDNTKQFSPPMPRCGSADPLSMTTQKSTAILRRASIQCEAVLTQSKTEGKIVNPLQDVDITSLQTPGPLHAVTMQYSSLPRKKAADKITTPNPSPTVNEEKPIQANIIPATQVLPDKFSKPANESLQPILEDSQQATNKHHSESKYHDRSSSSGNRQHAPQQRGTREKANTEIHSRLSPQLRSMSKVNIQPEIRTRPTAIRVLFPGPTHPHDKVYSKGDTQHTSTPSDSKSHNKMSDSPGKEENITRTVNQVKSSLHQAKGIQNSRQTEIDPPGNFAYPNSHEKTGMGPDSAKNQRSSTTRGEQDNQNLTSATKNDQKMSEGFSKTDFCRENTRKSLAKNTDNEKKSENGAMGEISTYPASEVVDSCKNMQQDQSVNDMDTKSDNHFPKPNERMKANSLKDVGDEKVPRPSATPSDIKDSGEKESYVSEKTINLKVTDKSNEANSQNTHSEESLKDSSTSKDGVSMIPLPITPRPLHTPDASILSDEGYSTCDSTSPKWRMGSHGYQSSEISSMSSGSVTSMNLFGDSFLQSQHHSSAMRHLMQERRKKCKSLGRPNTVCEVEDELRKNMRTSDSPQRRSDVVGDKTCASPVSGTILSSEVKGKGGFSVPNICHTTVGDAKQLQNVPESCITTCLSHSDEKKSGSKSRSLQLEGLIHTDSRFNIHDKAASISNISNKSHQNPTIKESKNSEIYPERNVAIIEEGPVLSFSVKNSVIEKETSGNASDTSIKHERYPDSDESNQPFRQTAV